MLQGSRTRRKRTVENTSDKLNLEKLVAYSREKNDQGKNGTEKSGTTKRTKSSKKDVLDDPEEWKQLEDPPVTASECDLSSDRLGISFFEQSCEELAKNLLGKILVRHLETGELMKGRIVETESYLGIIDKASHTYGKRMTLRNLPMYMPPGTIYVYMTYGMYHCFNISSRGEGSAVLIRALEPVSGLEHMSKSRKTTGKPLKPHEMCNGPSKLCMALQLDKRHSKYSLCTWRGLWIEEDRTESTDQTGGMKIVECPRIGIDSAGIEWAQKPLRYYIFGNPAVSKRDKTCEKNLSV